MKSTVKRIKSTFGFINGEGEKDVFFHESNLEGVKLHELREGSEVEFDLQETEKGLEATNVKLA
ncbi:MAG: cold shock domain-containing protein [Candidatus Heimdallarchaeota archaeon]|nr:cold shock domain-containing protein [Candidatus Heimdallarchaeota archaeon]